MEIQTKIGAGVITILSLLSLGLVIQPADTHYCMDRNLTYHCDGLSKYYGLDNGKCVHETLTNKLCRSGWEEIFLDYPEDTLPSIDYPENTLLNGSSQGESYLCDTEDCVLLG